MRHARCNTPSLCRTAAAAAALILSLSGGALMAQTNQTPTADAATTISVIPMPAKVALRTGEFRLLPETRILVPGEAAPLRSAAEFLRATLSPASGYTLPVMRERVTSPDPAADRATIVFAMADDADKLGPEGYGLSVAPDGVTIRASGAAGAFYAVQTLRQLLPPDLEAGPAGTMPNRGWAVPAVEITDVPRYAWRGMMLDSARHMQTKEFIKRFLDLMAFQKLNVFHWHLIDNNAWRMEVDSYRRLVEFSAFRGPAGHRYGGYYTKDDIREIVAHAAARHITVVPEFEMPAHSSAALAAYPELSCAGKPYDLLTTPTNGNTLQYFARGHAAPFCAGNEDVFKFHNAIFDEALELFPGEVWHVGGDERPKGYWEKCPKCQKRMKDEGIEDEHALQEWFMRRISDELAKRGKRAMSWAVTRTDPYNPTQMDSLGNNAIIQNWHDGTRFAASQGWDVVNANNVYLYFDYPQFPTKDKPDWMPILQLEKVYGFNPTPADLASTATHHILGGEACLWTEGVPQGRVAEMVFPRMLALAEIVWTPDELKDFADFRRRVDALEPRFEAWGMPYAKRPAGATDDDEGEAIDRPNIMPTPAQ